MSSSEPRRPGRWLLSLALLLAALPLNEPIVQYGPFVMNSREEIEQALRDYSDGTFAAAA